MSAFTNHLGLIEYDGADGMPVPTSDGRAQWLVTGPPDLSYDVGAENSGESITIPPGLRTDLGSIPQIAWSAGFSPDGRGAKAYVLHDFLYGTEGTCVFNGMRYCTRRADYTRAEADGILREALAVLGVNLVQRNIIWAAVRAGGANGWGS